MTAVDVAKANLERQIELKWQIIELCGPEQFDLLKQTAREIKELLLRVEAE